MAEDNLLSLSYGRIVRKNIASNDGLLPDSFETYQIVRPGDVVLRLTDLQNDQRSLRSGLVQEVGIITSAYVAVRPQGIDPSYFAYLLRAYDTTKVFYSMGGGLRQAMKYADLKRTPVLLPPSAEQLAIASFLDRETSAIDVLIDEQRRLIELMQEKRRVVISDSVTKGLKPDAQLKPSGVDWIGNIPGHWQVQRVKAISAFTTSGPRDWSERLGDTGALFVQSGDVGENLTVDFASAKRVAVPDGAEAARTRLMDGDVLVCITGAKTGNVGVCEAVHERAYVNQHLCLIRPTGTLLPYFLGAVLKSAVGQEHFDRSQYGLKQGLSLSDVREAPVLVPPHAEQRAICDYLREQLTGFDSLVAQSEREIHLLEERRASLISAAVTGKIDVRNYAADQAEAA